jgi:prefoldin subunit 5
MEVRGMSEELAQLRGLYAVGNIEDWSGQTEYEIAELLGQALDIADQQAARIAELEAEVARLRDALEKIGDIAEGSIILTPFDAEVQIYVDIKKRVHRALRGE